MITQKENPKKQYEEQHQLSEQLKELQREQNVKEILSEHQLYHFSYKRFKQNQNIKLITEEAVEAMKAAKKINSSTKVKVPEVTFLINNLIIFTYQGVQFIIVSFENAKVKLFDATTGQFEQEFFFYDNLSLTNDKTQDKNSIEIQNSSQNKSLKEIELCYMKRKQQREKGLYKPCIPEFTGLQKFENNSPDKSPSSPKILNRISTKNQQQTLKENSNESYLENIQQNHIIDQNQETFEIQESIKNKNQKNEQNMKIQNYLNCDFWEYVESNTPMNPYQRPLYKNKTSLSKTLTFSKQQKSSNQNNQKSINAKISMFSQEEDKQLQAKNKVTSPKDQIIQKTSVIKIQNRRDSSENSQKQEYNSPRNIILKNAFVQPKQVLQNNLKQEMQTKSVSINQNLKQKLQEKQEEAKEFHKNNRHIRSKTLIQSKNKKQKQKYNYSILGIEQLYQRDDHNKINRDVNRMDENHAYGLSDDIFTFTKDKNKKRYPNELWDMVKNEIEKYEEQDGNQLKSSLERIKKFHANQKNSSINFNLDLSEDNKKGKFKNQKKDKKSLIDEILQKKNILDNKIFELKEKQEIFGNWITEFDTQQRVDATKIDQKAAEQEQNQKQKIVVKNKFLPKNNKAQENGGLINPNNKFIEQEFMNQKTTKYMENIEIMNQSLESGPIVQNDKKIKKRNQSSKIEINQIKDDLQRQRNIRIKQYNEQLQEWNEEEKSKLNRQNKIGRKTYPMCIQYFEPFSIAVFALVSREIQIQKLKKTGVRVNFSQVQSLRVENMITEISLDQYSDKNSLILCVATMSKYSKKSEVVVYKLDSRFEFEIACSWRWTWPEDQITAMLYKQNCGLILASFSGFMEIFDGKTINQSIWDNHKQLNNKSSHLNSSVPHGSISCLAYSESRDVIAFSGVKGSIYIIDQTIKYQCGYIEAHGNEVVILKFNDKQYQLISIAVNGVVGLWDSQKFTKIQILRPPDQMTQKSITSCDFYIPTGRLMLATSQIFNYDLQINQDILINTQQQNAIARDYLRQYQYQLIEAGILDIQQIEADSNQVQQIEEDYIFNQQANNLEGSSQITVKTQDSLQKKPQESKNAKENKQKSSINRHKKIILKEITEKKFYQTAYLDHSIKDYLPPQKEFNSSVLPCQFSKLIGCILDSQEFFIYTIDSDLMVRQWDAATGISQKSYMIETREDQIAEDNNENIDGQQKKNNNRKAQFVKADQKFQYIYISFEGGLIQINCLKTGILIYNNSTVDPIIVENEVANFQIFEQSSKFWIAVCCFDGKVAFVTRPQFSQGRNFLKVQKCKGSHQKDVISLDIFQNQVVTASTDNVICFWNSFSGKEQKIIKIPIDIAKSEKNEVIQQIRFPFKNKKDLLMVILNNGEIYIIETQSEKFLKLNQSFEKNYSGHNLQKQSSKFLSVDQSIQKNNNEKSQKLLENSSSQFLYKDQQEQQNLRNPNILGVIEKYPIINFQDQYLLSCNDQGKGSLNFIKMNIEITNQTNLLKLGNQIPIILEKKGKFDLKIQEFNPIFELCMCLKNRIFITCQQNGQITLFNLDTIHQLIILNSEPFNLPLSNNKNENKWPKMLTECKKQINANKEQKMFALNQDQQYNAKNIIDTNQNTINFMSYSRMNMLLNEESLLLSPDIGMKTEPDNESSLIIQNQQQSKIQKFGTVQSTFQNQSTLPGTQMSVQINKNLQKKNDIKTGMQSVQQNYTTEKNM